MTMEPMMQEDKDVGRTVTKRWNKIGAEQRETHEVNRGWGASGETAKEETNEE
jgi:hypothetical protein